MPRDSGGNYTLPSGNPVVSGTVIESIWANDTMSDIAVQLNNVITRDGLLGPLLPFLVVDGTVALPGLAFALAPSTGLYRFAPNTVGMSIAGVLRQSWAATGVGINTNLAVTGNFQASGDASVTGDLAIGGDTAIVGDLTVTGSINGGLSVVGPVLLGDGTVLLPAYSFTSDPNTGMYRAAADTLAWTLGGGSAVMQLAPGGLLSVNSSFPTTNGVSVVNSGVGASCASGYVAQNDVANVAQFVLTNSSYSTYALAGARAGLLYADGAGGLVINAALAGSTIRFAAGGINEQMRLDASGNLLIGSTSVISAGAVGNLTLNRATSVEMVFGVGGTGKGYAYADTTMLALGAFNAAFLRFDTAGTERMRIDASGALTVAGTSTFSDNLAVVKSNSGGDVKAYVINTAFGVNSRAIAEISNGGTTIGSDAFTHYVNQGTWDWSTGIHAQSSSYRISVSSHLNSPVLTVTTGLFVGIGNSSPSFKLDVQSTTTAVPGLHVDVAGAPNQGMLKLGDRSAIAGGGDYLGWQFIDATTTRVYIGTNGYIGINTGGAAAYPIDVTDSTAAVVRLRHTSGASAFLQANANTDVRVGALSAHPVYIIGNGATRMRIPYEPNFPLYMIQNGTDYMIATDAGSSVANIPIGAIVFGQAVITAGSPAFSGLGTFTCGTGGQQISWGGFTPSGTTTTITVGTWRNIGASTAGGVGLFIRVG